MATDTAEPTSLQTGTTPNPIASNSQDFSDSDDEILDNFAEGPQPGDPPPTGDTHDDGTPMGLGGEKGKQAEPASATLEADLVNGTTTQTGEKLPPDDPAGEPQPVQEPASEEGAETSPEPASDEPETPEFPPALLQMAGYADVAAAQAAGFQDPQALLAAVRWRSQLLTPGALPAQPDSPSGQGLYRRPAQRPTPPAEREPKPETTAEPETTGEAFQVPSDKRDMLDEDLLAVLDDMNQHYQQQMESLRSSVSQRESDLARQQEQNEEVAFDEAVQDLGEQWHDVFGEGSGTDLDRAAQSDPAAMTHFNHRAMLFETVDAVREINAKQGYKPMTLEQEVQWALLQRYPDKFQQLISGSSNGSGQRRGVTASRPTQRRTPPAGRNEQVLSDVNAMLKKKGRPPLEVGHEEEFDGEI